MNNVILDSPENCSLNGLCIRVLLIDDQPIVSEAVRRMLMAENDINFHYCSHASQAISLSTQIMPTVILQDLVMPDIEGLLLLKFFRANPATHDIPIIVLSSKEDAQLKSAAFTQGANDYLIKLPDKIELIARIRYHSKAHINFLKQKIAYQELQLLRQTLEHRVEERTRELTDALQNLQETQSQLVHSEKMSSLGQLVAGIAHEINNPINFISANVEPATQYFQDLMALLKLYQSSYPHPPSEIQALSQNLDLDFMCEDLQKIMGSMQLGSERIREIVKNLKNFSRLDEADLKWVDIHEGIESTLTILGHRLQARTKRASIKLVKNYGKLPLVECYPGQLNQVFMNLMANAIEAFDSTEEAYRNNPTIHIITEAAENNTTPESTSPTHDIVIRIVDNGTGISPEVQQRIFDPFFTTKPAGKGTGLGLSISYKIIVEKHKGLLRCISQPGEGTEFIITIPRRQSNVSNDYSCHPTISNNISDSSVTAGY